MSITVKQMTVGMMGVCCYLVKCDATGEGCIIDPGGNEPEILAVVKQLDMTVKYIVNTHGHPDHVCGNAVIQQATKALIVMHVDDEAFFNQPANRQFFAQLGLSASPPADKTVTHGDLITFGQCTLSVIHTPGHTPGGICLYSAPHLFSGDTLFVGAVGRTDFPGGDATALRRAIKERLLTLPPETTVWPGHGYGGDQSTIAIEQRDNPFLNGGW